jgi:hypothetical protein
MKCYTVEYKTTNKIKEREFNDLSKAYEFAEVQGMEGYDVRIYDNTRENRKVIAEDWGVR